MGVIAMKAIIVQAVILGSTVYLIQYVYGPFTIFKFKIETRITLCVLT